MSGNAPWKRQCGGAGRLPPLPRRLVAVQPYLQQLAVSGIGEQVKEAVRPHTHVTDTRIQVLEQTLLADDPIAIQLQPDQRQVHQGADEQAALPGRKRSAS